MTRPLDRRTFVRDLGIGAAAVPFALSMPSLGFANHTGGRKKRLVVMFSPNGVVPPTFWPDEEGEKFKLKESLKPLAPFKDRMLILKGVCNRVRADGDSHMRGIGCLLTGIELFPGNIQGGSDTPAGWAKGLSIDQEIRNQLQANPETRTRFGSLEFGVNVSERADTWTRMVYTGANRPIAPVNSPYQVLKRMYGQMRDKQALTSILDDVREDLARLRSKVSAEDRGRLEEHETFVREMEKQLKEEKVRKIDHPVPKLAGGVKDENDNIPRISRMQIELMVHSFAADFARIGTLQYTKSVGSARMRWLGIKEGHHDLSHKGDKDKGAQEKLTKINKWFAGELAYLVKRLAETDEPGGEGSLLDNTLLVWTNELGKGNSHTLNDIPFVLIGGGLDFRMGRSLKYKKVSHNRLLLSLAHGFDHRLETFGNPKLCSGGPLDLG